VKSSALLKLGLELKRLVGENSAKLEGQLSFVRLSKSNKN